MSATFLLPPCAVTFTSSATRAASVLSVATTHLHPFSATTNATCTCWHFRHTQFPDLCPSRAEGLTAATAAQLTRMPTEVRNALTAANRAEPGRVWPSDRARALLNNIFSRSGSMWLDAVPYVSSLRLVDQSFQDAGRLRAVVCMFSFFGTCGTCSCGNTVEDDEVAHALGCTRLSGLVRSRHDEMAEVLCEFVSHLGFSSSQRGRFSRPAPSTTPRHAETFTATCAPGLATFSPTSRSIIAWVLFRLQAIGYRIQLRDWITRVPKNKIIGTEVLEKT
jgi:hypothetical protein